MRNRLKEARFYSKKPQIQLWIETGIHFSTISRIECGYIQPTEHQRKALSRALGYEEKWIFPRGVRNNDQV